VPGAPGLDFETGEKGQKQAVFRQKPHVFARFECLSQSPSSCADPQDMKLFLAMPPRTR
jgi:hypothetical protein